MIKIIKGTYGYVDEDGYIQPKTDKSEPFSLNTEREKELVEMGVAEYVGDFQSLDEDIEIKENAEENLLNQVEIISFDEITEDEFEKMTKDELMKLIAEIGIAVPKRATKEQLISILTESDEDDE